MVLYTFTDDLLRGRHCAKAWKREGEKEALSDELKGRTSPVARLAEGQSAPSIAGLRGGAPTQGVSERHWGAGA